MSSFEELRESESFACRQLIRPLTTLNCKGPVAEALLRRRLLSLSTGAREALAAMLGADLWRRGFHINNAIFESVKLALVQHPEATASEVARVHQAGAVMPADVLDRLHTHHGHASRLTCEAIEYFKYSGRPIHPVASDRYYLAQLAVHTHDDGD